MIETIKEYLPDILAVYGATTAIQNFSFNLYTRMYGDISSFSKIKTIIKF